MQIGEDSLGIPMYKCLRGTSALEGYHQKVRQLIRGFNISPRFVIALLYEFIHRWNHDIDVRILGLPTEYANYYDGWDIEDEIDAMVDWEELVEDPPHMKWICSKYYASTGEDFGVVADNGFNNNSVETEVDIITQAMEEGTWDEGQVDERLDFYQDLPASAAWVAKRMRRIRGVKPVTTSFEKDFFEKHYSQFQGAVSEEADNLTTIQWGRFSSFWNQTI